MSLQAIVDLVTVAMELGSIYLLLSTKFAAALTPQPHSSTGPSSNNKSGRSSSTVNSLLSLFFVLVSGGRWRIPMRRVCCALALVGLWGGSSAPTHTSYFEVWLLCFGFARPFAVVQAFLCCFSYYCSVPVCIRSLAGVTYI